MWDDNRLNLSLSLPNEGQSIRPYARAEEGCSGRKRKFTFDEALVDNSLDKRMAPHTVKFVAPSLRAEQERAFMAEQVQQSFRKELEHEREAFRKELEELESFRKKLEELETFQKESEKERESFRKSLEESFRKELEKERESFRKEFLEREGLRKKLDLERDTIRKELENERETFQKESEKQEGLRKKLEHERDSIQKELENERETFRKEGEILRKELEQERESFRNKLEKEQETFETERKSFRKELEKKLEGVRRELEETQARMVELEDDNSELELAAREAEWKEQNMVKEMETIRTETEDCKKKLLAASTDIEWLLRKGISYITRQVLRSREFIEAQCMVNCAYFEFGVDIFCKPMRDSHVPSLPDSSLPLYNPKALEKVTTAFQALISTDYKLLTGFSDGRYTLEDLRRLSNVEATSV